MRERAKRILLISNSTLHGSGYLDHCAEEIHGHSFCLTARRRQILFGPRPFWPGGSRPRREPHEPPRRPARVHGLARGHEGERGRFPPVRSKKEASDRDHQGEAEGVSQHVMVFAEPVQGMGGVARQDFREGAQAIQVRRNPGQSHNRALLAIEFGGVRHRPTDQEMADGIHVTISHSIQGPDRSSSGGLFKGCRAREESAFLSVGEVYKAIAVVNLHLQQYQRPESQDSRHLGSNRFADGREIEGGQGLTFLPQMSELQG